VATVAAATIGLAAVACGPTEEATPSIKPAQPVGALIATSPARLHPGPDRIGPIDQECPRSVDRLVARFDLCYATQAVAPVPGSGRDRILLRVYGSVVADEGLGMTGWVVRVSPVAGASPTIVATWPRGTYSGPCSDVGVDLPIVEAPDDHDVLCPSTTVTVGPGEDPAEVVVDWACVDCPPPHRTTLGVSLYVLSDVAVGTVPPWEIRADVRP
jgi:hypothetical protein